MKRLFVMTLAMFIPLAVVVGMLLSTYEPGIPAEVRSALNGYLRYQRMAYAQSFTIKEIVRATHPWALTAEMSQASVGNSPFYRTTYNPETAESHNLDTLRALPYPPEEVWCAVLGQRDEPVMIVLVAQHQDLYNADWIVHEPANNSVQSVGCRIVSNQ